MGRRRSRYLRVLLLLLLLNFFLVLMSLLLNILLLDDEIERCAAPQHLGLIDRLVREHGPPGAPRRSQMSDVDCPTQLTCTKNTVGKTARRQKELLPQVVVCVHHPRRRVHCVADGNLERK